MASETPQSTEQHVLLPLGESTDGGDSSRLTDEKRKQIEEDEWRRKYHEAALYLQEGERHDTEKHPSDKKLLGVYFVTKNKYFNLALLLTSVLYMALAIVEKPGQPLFYCPIPVQITIEVVCLTFFSVDLVMKMRWLGRNGFLRNTRSMLASVAVIALFIEMVVFYSIGSMQSRYLRILRSLLLLTNNYTMSVRRFMSDYVKSLGPIIRMLLLILLLVLFFALLGFNLFSKHNPYFNTFKSSFVSLFVLLTTANFPDVMMPSYAMTPISVIFFIPYIASGIYLMLNLLFAVVYNKFTETQLAMLKGIFHHRRRCAEKAFYLLSFPESPHELQYAQFEVLMHHYCPKLSSMDIYCIFKVLDDDNSGSLRLAEFCNIYEERCYKWHKVNGAETLCHWWMKLQNLRVRQCLSRLNRFLNSRIFLAVVYTIIIINTLAIVMALVVESDTEDEYQEAFHTIELMCSIIYILETILKMIAFGPKTYFHHGWNIFDFIISWTAFIGQMVEVFYSCTTYVAVVRPLRLLRLLEADEFYRHILATALATVRIFGTMAIVIIVVYYTYGIIGIGVFYDAPLENCCSGASIANYYTKNNFTDGYFYKNNFNDILSTMVTLFELTVINNWFVIMDAHSIVYSEWARLFFMVFYLQMMILMNMVLSSILGSFMFRMQYKRRVDGDATTDLSFVYKKVSVNNHEISRVHNQHKTHHHTSSQKSKKRQFVELEALRKLKLIELAALDAEKIDFEGKRKKQEYELSLEMHESEVRQWRNEANFLGNMKRILHRAGISSKNVPTVKKPERTEPPDWITRKYWNRWVIKSKKYVRKAYWIENTEKVRFENSEKENSADTNGVKNETPSIGSKLGSMHAFDANRKSEAASLKEPNTVTSTPLNELATPANATPKLGQPTSQPSRFSAFQSRREPKLLTVLINAMKMKAAEQEQAANAQPRKEEENTAAAAPSSTDNES